MKTTARQDQHTGVITGQGGTQWGSGKVVAFQAVKIAESMFEETCCSARIFPNPANDMVYISTNSTQLAELYSIDGQLIGKFEIGRNKGIDVSAFISGMYLIVLDNGQSHLLIVDH